MSAQPESLSELPERQDPAQQVRDGLRCLQLSGAIFLLAQFTRPWAYESADSESLEAMFQPRGRRVIVFHIFTEGQAIVGLPRGDQVDVEPGDVVILPFGDQHLFGHPSLRDATPIRRLWPPQPWSPLTVIRHGGGGPRTSMVCGYLLSDDVPLNPVLASLPALMRVRPRGGPLSRWVEASVDYALHASTRSADGDPLLQRLPELLFTECLCEFAATDPNANQGWLAGLQDPAVGKALAGMHRDPQIAWTLESLAKRAGASRSVLDQRFRALLGKAPMSYLAAWRFQLAARQLRTTPATLAEVATAVGYGSEASFSKAFKRHVGSSPGEWRAQTAAQFTGR
jgi:AraC family transcriptional regulator, alkane utilization regulator